MADLAVDPLEWARSLPVSGKFTDDFTRPSVMPVVPAHEGWVLNVSRDGNLFRVAGRRGSRIVIQPRLSFDQVESFNPNEGWKK